MIDRLEVTLGLGIRMSGAQRGWNDTINQEKYWTGNSRLQQLTNCNENGFGLQRERCLIKLKVFWWCDESPVNGTFKMSKPVSLDPPFSLTHSHKAIVTSLSMRFWLFLLRLLLTRCGMLIYLRMRLSIFFLFFFIKELCQTLFLSAKGANCWCPLFLWAGNCGSMFQREK